MNFFDECVTAINNISSTDEYAKYSSDFVSREKYILLGNGGSNSVASHIAQDLTKRGSKRALSFTDPSMLTCFINDYGPEFAYQRYLEFFSDDETLVIVISSSGRSRNLVNAVGWCIEKSIPYGVLTAFDSDNTIRSMSKDAMFNYYIDTHSYGVAECVHQIFLHGVVECS